ncbi:UNVERIFIED_CONTAM: hypothetical protein K2H54_049189 [Gekko kuhli]
MNSDEEDTHVPDETVPVTTAPVTTAPPMKVPTTVVPVMMHQPLNLQVTTWRKTGATFEWLIQNTTTQEMWSLTPGLQRKSRYEYEPGHEMRPHETQRRGALRTSGASAKGKGPNLKTDVRDLHMKQGVEKPATTLSPAQEPWELWL